MNETSRRRFLQGVALAASSLAAPTMLQATAARSLKLLILGGTGFLGPHTVRHALAQGHEVTLFNRGRSNTHLFPQLEKLKGDRDGQLEALQGREWDAVIDTSGYVPRHVRLSAELLAPRVGQYLFVSTISVYADFATAGMDETAELGTMDDTSVEEVTGATYGPLKALCEQAAEAALPGRTTIIRPGLIVGPGDRTDRYTYWPVRVADGGPVLAPGNPDANIQFIDVRDLAEFMVLALENSLTQVYNADRPAASLSTRQMLESCRTASSSDAEFRWASAEWLARNNVQPWSDMPVWMPDNGPYAAMGEISTARAHTAGLTHRSVVDTARDTLAWFREQPAERQAGLKAGLKRERENELLKKLATG